MSNQWLALLAFASISFLAAPTFAQGTAFSYQGHLNDNGSPANGIYDLRFTVCDALTNGDILAGPVTNSATGVSNGLFTVTLDFGGGVFTGPARWLQLDVQTNGNGTFTTLLPRQPILPTPYAIMAGTASNLSGTLPASQLSGLAGNFMASNITFTGSITGDGSGLTNLNVAASGGVTNGGSFTGTLNATGGNVAVLSSNLIPANAKYQGDNQLYTNSFVIGQTYMVVWGLNNSGDILFLDNQLQNQFTNGTAGSITIFTAPTNVMYFFGTGSGILVDDRLYSAVGNQLAAGTMAINSILANTAQINSLTLGTPLSKANLPNDVQYQSDGLNIYSTTTVISPVGGPNNNGNMIVASNSVNRYDASLLGLMNLNISNYTDINWLDSSKQLRIATGLGNAKAPYPYAGRYYVEMYDNVTDYTWLNGSGIFGGVQSGTGDIYWNKNKNTNAVFFFVDAVNGVVDGNFAGATNNLTLSQLTSSTLVSSNQAAQIAALSGGGSVPSGITTNYTFPAGPTLYITNGVIMGLH